MFMIIVLFIGLRKMYGISEIYSGELISLDYNLSILTKEFVI